MSCWFRIDPFACSISSTIDRYSAQILWISNSTIRSESSSFHHLTPPFSKPGFLYITISHFCLVRFLSPKTDGRSSRTSPPWRWRKHKRLLRRIASWWRRCWAISSNLWKVRFCRKRVKRWWRLFLRGVFWAGFRVTLRRVLGGVDWLLGVGWLDFFVFLWRGGDAFWVNLSPSTDASTFLNQPWDIQNIFVCCLRIKHRLDSSLASTSTLFFSCGLECQAPATCGNSAQVAVWKPSFAIRLKWPPTASRLRLPLPAVAARKSPWQHLRNKVKNITCYVFVRKLGKATNVGVCGDLLFLGVEWMYQQIWIIFGYFWEYLKSDDKYRMFLVEH